MRARRPAGVGSGLSFHVIHSGVIDEVPAIAELSEAAFHADSSGVVSHVFDDDLVVDPDEFAGEVLLEGVCDPVRYPVVSLPAELAVVHLAGVGECGDAFEREGDARQLESGVFVEFFVKFFEVGYADVGIRRWCVGVAVLFAGEEQQGGSDAAKDDFGLHKRVLILPIYGKRHQS